MYSTRSSEENFYLSAAVGFSTAFIVLLYTVAVVFTLIKRYVSFLLFLEIFGSNFGCFRKFFGSNWAISGSFLAQTLAVFGSFLIKLSHSRKFLNQIGPFLEVFWSNCVISESFLIRATSRGFRPNLLTSGGFLIKISYFRKFLDQNHIFPEIFRAKITYFQKFLKQHLSRCLPTLTPYSIRQSLKLKFHIISDTNSQISAPPRT